MGTPVRQMSFAGGELSPTLHSRSDTARYASSVRRMRNMWADPHGAAVSRAGTAMLGSVKDETRQVRLVPFVYSDSQSYVLEVGHLYIRFWQASFIVFSGGFTPLEVVTTYTEAELPRLKFVQLGDVLFLVHPSHPPRTLTRTAHTSWVLADISFSRPAAYFDGGLAALSKPLPTSDATHPEQEWKWKLTTLIQDTATGVITETAPHLVTAQVDFTAAEPWSYASAAPATIACYADKPVTLRWPVPTVGLLYRPTGWDTYRRIATLVYRGRGSLFGYVGQTATDTFVDVGEAPDYSQPPPDGRNPFEVYDYTNALERTERPAAVCFFEERLTFANTTQRPGWLWLSRTGDYYNFDTHTPSVPDDAVEVELASRRREEVRSLLPAAQGLLAFTNAAVWALRDVSGEGFSISTGQARVQETVGASWLEPLEVSGDVLYSREKGSGVRALSYSEGRGGYTGGDVSLLARHLFEAGTLVDWCYQEDPHGLVWAVRDDGTLLSLTYVPSQEVVAWATHDTDGVVEAVCSVPESTEDGVYLVVRRTVDGATRRYVERFGGRTPEAPRLDSFVLRAPGAELSVAHLEGREVWAVAYRQAKPKDTYLTPGEVYGPLTVDAVTGVLTLEEPPMDATHIAVGLRFDAEMELLDVADPRNREKNVTQVAFEVLASRGFKVGVALEDDLQDATFRDTSEGYGPQELRTGLVDAYVNDVWNKEGRACLRQEDPLPLTVLGVTREVDFGGP